MSTPKEKATELVKKFYPIVQWKLGQEDCLIRAKKCALIAVDEIINYLTTSLDVQTSLIAVNYWQEVKQEIEKL
jgi:hypothetical protein